MRPAPADRIAIRIRFTIGDGRPRIEKLSSAAGQTDVIRDENLRKEFILRAEVFFDQEKYADAYDEVARY